jgi:hypothetical protein
VLGQAAVGGAGGGDHQRRERRRRSEDDGRLPDPERALGAEPGKRVAADPELRRELDVCERFGISHSHYLGGPAVWTAEDREKVRAYDEWKIHCCARCRTHRDWWDPSSGGHRFAFVGDTRRCPGCEVLDQTSEEIPKEAKGVRVVLIPNPQLHGEESNDD